MNDNFLAGLLVGLFIGGFIGTLAMALVAAGSEQRLTRALREVAPAARTASPSEQTWAESSMRVDLLLDLREVPRHAELLVVRADDIEEEMRQLVRRYGTPSGS